MPYNEYSWENELESIDLDNPRAVAAFQLKVFHSALSSALKRAKEQQHKNMKEISPGIWIHKKYNTLSDALKDFPIPSCQ